MVYVLTYSPRDEVKGKIVTLRQVRHQRRQKSVAVSHCIALVGSLMFAMIKVNKLTLEATAEVNEEQLGVSQSLRRTGGVINVCHDQN
jgi:hypothetical protein